MPDRLAPQSGFWSALCRLFGPWMLLALAAAAVVAAVETLAVAWTLGLDAPLVVLALPVAVFCLDLAFYLVLGLAQLPLLWVLRRLFLGQVAQAWLMRRLFRAALYSIGSGYVGYLLLSLMMARTERFTDRPFAAAMVALVAPLVAVFGALVVLLVDQLRWRIFEGVRAFVARPKVRLLLLVGCVLLLLLPPVYTLVQFGHLLLQFRLLFWLLLFAGIQAILLAIYFHLAGLRRLVDRVWSSPLLLLGLVPVPLCCAALAHLLLLLQPQLAPAMIRAGGVSGPTLQTLRSISDFDGDGASQFFAGGDCAGFDAAVHPLATEIAGNGLDENCDGQDALVQQGQQQRLSYYGEVPASLRRQYNIVVICIDALRADHVSFLGYERNTTPYLDRLARKSWIFANTISTSATTRQSVPPLFTGRYVSGLVLRPDKPVDQLEEENLLLAEILKEQGYQTVAVVDEWLPKFLGSMSQGFDFFQTAYGLHKWHDHGQHAGPHTNAKALEELTKRKNKTPFLLYLHYEAPHFPYVAHPEVRTFGHSPMDLYDSEIAYADSHMGAMLEMLEARGLLKETVIVVFGDHGEEFMEHGKTQHSRSLHGESIHVPLLVHVPGQKPGRFEGRTSLVDVVPTLMDLLGLRPPGLKPHGQSLLHQTLGGHRDLDRPVLSELLVIEGGKREKIKALYLGRHKILWNMTTGEKKIYDVRSDPGELRPLNDPALLERLTMALQQELAQAKDN